MGRIAKEAARLAAFPLYESIVKNEWAVNSTFMALYAFAVVLIYWVLLSYEMTFRNKLLPLWARGAPTLGQKTFSPPYSSSSPLLSSPPLARRCSAEALVWPPLLKLTSDFVFASAGLPADPLLPLLLGAVSRSIKSDRLLRQQQVAASSPAVASHVVFSDSNKSRRLLRQRLSRCSGMVEVERSRSIPASEDSGDSEQNLVISPTLSNGFASGKQQKWWYETLSAAARRSWTNSTYLVYQEEGEL
nr:Ammonium transporter [Ipomoea batatas]GME11480.1 Ammonium transporter [Ipomoea batatas]